MDVVRDHGLLKDLDPGFVEKLAGMGLEAHFQPDQIVFREGDLQWRELRHYPEIAIGRRGRASSLADDATIPEAWRQHSVSQGVKNSDATNPSSFPLMVVCAVLIWPVGMIGSIVYLCDARYRSAGFALFCISLASCFVAQAMLHGCRG